MDDVFVLLAFFADRRFRPDQIVVEQYIGMSALMIVSVTLSLVSLVLSPEHIGLLGLSPVLIGLGMVILDDAGSLQLLGDLARSLRA